MDKQHVTTDHEEQRNGNMTDKLEYTHTNPSYEGYSDFDRDLNAGNSDIIDNKERCSHKPLFKRPCFYLALLVVILFAAVLGVAVFVAEYLERAKSLNRIAAIKDSNRECGNQNIHLELQKPYILTALANQSDVAETTIRCIWKVRSPQGTRIMVKISYLTDVFKLTHLENELVFGSGLDPGNHTSVIKRISRSNKVPPRIHTGFDELWIQYSRRKQLDLVVHLFDIQLVALHKTDLCGTRPAFAGYKPRIVAGDEASDGAWPWMGSLRYTVPPNFREHMCGASLITPTIAITAAHCVDTWASDLALLGVVFGSNKLNENSTSTISARVDRTFLHPDYDRYLYPNDIAVLQLSEPITLTDYVRPVCLQTTSDEVGSYSTCYVAGWGQKWPTDRVVGDPTNTTHPNTLQETRMNLISLDDCRDEISRRGEILVADGDICTLSPHGLPSSCYGDSGGPLMCLDDLRQHWYQVGLVSRGYECNSTSNPNIFAGVSSNIDFIKSFIQHDLLEAVKCEPVPSPCSQFLPYNRTTFGITNSVIQYVNRVHSDLIWSTERVEDLYMTWNSSSTVNKATLENTYKVITESSFVSDFLTSFCAHYFRSCSLDGPVLGPCRTFFEDTYASGRRYIEPIRELLQDQHFMEYMRNIFFYPFPYANNSEEKFCVQGVEDDVTDARCGERNIFISHDKPYNLSALNPQYPNTKLYEHYLQRCTWMISATPGQNIIAKITYLTPSFRASHNEKHLLAVGYGNDAKRLDTLMLRVADYMIPPALFVDYSEVWIRYSNAMSYGTFIFTIELFATTLPDLHSICDNLSNCLNDDCLALSLRCDNVTDCHGVDPIDEVECDYAINGRYSGNSRHDVPNSPSRGNYGPAFSAGGAGQNTGERNPNSEDTILNSALCGTTPAGQPAQRIINGNDVTPGKWPWIGSVRKSDGFYEHHCGAVLIASEWALTAAHCLHYPKLYEVTVESVVFGDVSLSESSASHIEVEIERVFIHPMYNTISSWNDVAVLKLATPVNFTNYVRPICSHHDASDTVYSTCYTAGWGMQSLSSSENRSTILQDIPVNVVDTDTCRSAFRSQEPYQTALDNELCYLSVDANQSPCYVSSCPEPHSQSREVQSHIVNPEKRGDSGGPVMCLDTRTNRWNLLGIVSHTIDCNIDNTPGLAAKVSRYMPYITSLIADGTTNLQCEAIEAPCADILPYTMTSSGLQTGLNPILDGLFQIDASECHPDYKYFVCASVYYDCVGGGRVREPCENFCRDILVTSNCSHADNQIERFYIMQKCAQFPSAEDTSQKLCRVDIDEVCTPESNITLTLNEPFLLNSIGYPEYKIIYVDCYWIATAPPGATVLFKFQELDLQEHMEALTIGIGDDSQDRLSIILRSWKEGVIPSPVFTGSRKAWIRYATHLPFDTTPVGFLVEIWATNAEEADLERSCQNLPPNNSPSSLQLPAGNDNCDIRSCFPSWWRCDNVIDCADGNDEYLCPGSNIERQIQLVTEVATEIVTQLPGTDDSVTQRTSSGTEYATTISILSPNVDFKYPTTCGLQQESYTRRIVGGADAVDGDWPWMVSLQGSNGQHTCGATLIHKQWVITAAHCTDHISLAVLGSTSTSSKQNGNSDERIEVPVEDVYRLPNYNPTNHEGDIALVKLAAPVTFSAFVQPVCLGRSTQEKDAYDGCSIIGWGYLTEGGLLSSDLQVATVPLMMPSECRPTVPLVTDNMLCAGRPEGGVDSCQGDSGGPLLCVDELNSWYIVGVTSFGSGCGRPNSPGVYTRISKYLDFINSTLHHH